MEMKKKKVVITGMGALTPIGIGVKTFWENLTAGKSGISNITLFDTEDMDVKIGGEIKNFDPLDYMDKTDARRMTGSPSLFLRQVMKLLRIQE